MYVAAPLCTHTHTRAASVNCIKTSHILSYYCVRSVYQGQMVSTRIAQLFDGETIDGQHPRPPVLAIATEDY